MKKRYPFIRAVMIVVYAFIFLPIFIVALMSFNASQYGTFPFVFSTKWYVRLFTGASLGGATWLSIWFSLLVTLTMVVVGVMTSLPPSLLITSDNDNLQSYTLNFEKALRRHQMPHKLINYPKDPRLTHAFSAFYPELPESREVIHHLIHFFEHTGDDCKGGYVS